jgi:hypothetical protein
LETDGTTKYPNPGDVYLQVNAFISGGNTEAWPQDFSTDDVHIADVNITSWWSVYSLPKNGGTGPGYWIFSCPAGYAFQNLWIYLPDNVIIDLTPLLPPSGNPNQPSG